jgi:2-dehydropantoate 2-reductase
MRGSIGAWLVRAGQPVLFVDTDEQRARVMRDAGLKIFGPVDEFSLDADCVHPSDVTSEITTVFLAVKAHHTEASVQAIEPLLARDAVVVSIQNGLNDFVIATAVDDNRPIRSFVNFGADALHPVEVIRGWHLSVETTHEVDHPGDRFLAEGDSLPSGGHGWV